MLERQLSDLAELRLSAITPTVVRTWYTGLGPGAPVLRAHAYGLLRTILSSAVAEQVIPTNPCVMHGAGSAKTTHRPRPATLTELATVIGHMPERLRLAVLIAAWCGPRFGELIELRRSDIDLGARVLRIRRAAYRVPGKPVAIGKPKSDAGIRDVAIPPHLVPEFKRHMADMPFGRDALLFPGTKGEHLAPSALYRHFYPAREAAGRPDLRWHDLRHTGATLAAATGASLAELMARLGHSTAGAAMRYQHAAQDRDRVIAEALSRMAEGV
jgi:integrase